MPNFFKSLRCYIFRKNISTLVAVPTYKSEAITEATPPIEQRTATPTCQGSSPINFVSIILFD